MSELAVMVTDYCPEPDLDDALARLGYAVIRGWPDQRPVSPSLVRSRLRPPGAARPTVLAVARSPAGTVIGAAALRCPAERRGLARLWGPVVHPDHRRRGVGRLLYGQVMTAAGAGELRISTAEIPQKRTGSARFYEHLGWHAAPAGVLLKRPLPCPEAPAGLGPAIDALRPGDRPVRQIARLYARAFPESGPLTAAGTFDRWRADERFTSDGLLLARLDRRIVGAALAYVLHHLWPGEPAEVLLADILIDPDLAEHRVLRRELALRALHSGVRAGAAVARAIIREEDHELHHTLTGELGFDEIDAMLCYRNVLAG